MKWKSTRKYCRSSLVGTFVDTALNPTEYMQASQSLLSRTTIAPKWKRANSMPLKHSPPLARAMSGKRASAVTT